MTLNSPFLLLFLLLNKTYIATAEEQNARGEKISLSVPQLTDEENQSNHMPTHLRCDACLTVVHQINTAFTKFKEMKSSIKESDIIDILENTCNNGFNE